MITNETLKTIAQRYSCRSYDGRPVEKEKLDAIALAAVQSPSAMNFQPWQINVITDKALIDEMDVYAMKLLSEASDKGAYNRFMDWGGKIYYNTPCMFLILSKGGGADIGIVSENIAIAATSLGLGSVICGMAGTSFGGPKGEEYKQKAGFSEGWGFGLAVLVGYETKPGSPHEVDMNKIKFIE
jgi:nitroreductase